MKPDSVENAENREDDSVTGDVIGNTVYSERFVLKLLMKLTNLETLQSELQQENIEDDFCTLWDMTAERDVVLFLLKHDAFNLLKFAWPAFESPRIVEVVIGTIGNMCCQKEAVQQLLKMDSFMSRLVEYAKCDDTLILIQLLRLINSSLYLSDDNVEIWMKIFIQTEYSTALYFILKSSANKDLLITAIESFNSVSSQCNVEKCRTDFFKHFVTPTAIESLTTAFSEISINQKDSCQSDEFERVLLITLEIFLNLVGFDQSLEIYDSNTDSVIGVISFIFTYYETKFVDQKEIDMDLVDIIDSTMTIIKCLQLFRKCDLTKFFLQCSHIWSSLGKIISPDEASSFEMDDVEELQSFSVQIKTSLSSLMLLYMGNCSNENLFEAIDEIGNQYEDILRCTENTALAEVVCTRTRDYFIRLKETQSC